MSIASMLPHVATIQRATLTADGGGSQTKACATLYSDVHCCMVPLSARELAARGRGPMDRMVKMYFEPFGQGATEVAPQPPDRVSWDSRTFEIVGLYNAHEADRLIVAELLETG